MHTHSLLRNITDTGHEKLSFWEEDQKALTVFTGSRALDCRPSSSRKGRCQAEERRCPELHGKRGAQSPAITSSQDTESSRAPVPLHRLKQSRFSGNSPALNEAPPPGCSHCPQLTAHMASRCLLTTPPNNPLPPSSLPKPSVPTRRSRSTAALAARPPQPLAAPGSSAPREAQPLPRPPLPASTQCRDRSEMQGAQTPAGQHTWLGTLQSQPWGPQQAEQRQPCKHPSPQLGSPAAPAFLRVPLLNARCASHPSEDTDAPPGTLRSCGPGVTLRHISCRLTQTISRH